jgi:light-regulated signal transduction histidine kinase (bacteriophytochrome)
MALQQNAAEHASANKELESFSYSVSHDLRAPLRSIDGFAQALAEDYEDRLDDTGRDYLGRIRRAAQRMGMLIDDLLSLSRVARLELTRTAVDLTAVVTDAAHRLREQDPDRIVEWRIQPGITAEGDARLLQVAIDNLIGNAWKFTTKHNPAVIEFGIATLEGGRRAFMVRDNGAGFDMAHATKLFGAFQRLHGVTEFPGTGVGLATVHRIVHRHGGRIWAESAVGAGATFYFTLEA